MSKDNNNTESKVTGLTYTTIPGDIDNSSIDSKNVQAILESMLADRITLNENVFTKVRDKTVGRNIGYIATDGRDQMFMLKEFNTKQLTLEEVKNNPLHLPLFKKIRAAKDNIRAAKDNIRGAKDNIFPNEYIWNEIKTTVNLAREDSVSELIGSDLYKTLLYDRTPSEALVESSKEGKLYIRSKFLENAQGLSSFSGSNIEIEIKPQSKKLRELQGFEKVIAACNILGEIDYHPENVMVQNNTAVKIDHGKSLKMFFNDWRTLVNKTNERFNALEYNEAINYGLKFDIKEYSNLLNQMLKQLDDDKIDALISRNIAKLKKTDFDPKDIVVYSFNQDGTDPKKTITNFDELEQHYKTGLNQHVHNMQDIAKKMEIVAQFSNVDPAFKNGRWLEKISSSPYKDPVEYAIRNNIQIAGLDATEWQAQHNYHFTSTLDLQRQKIEDINIKISQEPENPTLRREKYNILRDLYNNFDDTKVKLECCEEIIKNFNQQVNLKIGNTFNNLKSEVLWYNQLATLQENAEGKIKSYEGIINCCDKAIDLKTNKIEYFYEKKADTLEAISKLIENQEIKNQYLEKSLECLDHGLAEEPNDENFLLKKAAIQVKIGKSNDAKETMSKIDTTFLAQKELYNTLNIKIREYEQNQKIERTIHSLPENEQKAFTTAVNILSQPVSNTLNRNNRPIQLEENKGKGNSFSRS